MNTEFSPSPLLVFAEHVGGDTNKLQVRLLVGDPTRTPARNTNKGGFKDTTNTLSASPCIPSVPVPN
jgi:hypothetical protein